MEDVLDLIPARRGHFRLESGHHGELWLHLESLFLQPERVRPFAERLAERVRARGAEVVCGPLVEGAFVALMVASALAVPFTYAGAWMDPRAGGLYPVMYRVPGALREEVRGKRVAVINDVVNAGSAVRKTIEDLQACGAQVVAIGALVVLGDWAPRFAAERGLALETLASRPNPIWEPRDCPLCRSGVPLEG